MILFTGGVGAEGSATVIHETIFCCPKIQSYFDNNRHSIDCFICTWRLAIWLGLDGLSHQDALGPAGIADCAGRISFWRALVAIERNLIESGGLPENMKKRGCFRPISTKWQNYF